MPHLSHPDLNYFANYASLSANFLSKKYVIQLFSETRMYNTLNELDDRMPTSKSNKCEVHCIQREASILQSKYTTRECQHYA